MTFDPTHHDRNDEIEEAQEAKEEAKDADPKTDDPSYMPNIIPQTGDGDGDESKDK